MSASALLPGSVGEAAHARLRPAAAFLLAATAVAAASGCGVPRPVQRDDPNFRMTHIPGLLSLPQGQQRLDCGPETLAAVFAYHGRPVSVHDISREIFNPNLNGTVVSRVPEYVRAQGFEPVLTNATIAEIREAVNLRRPPIVMVRWTEEIFHFFVVVAYSDENRYLAFLDYPQGGEPRWGYLSYDKFMRYWEPADRFMMEVTPAQPTLERAVELEHAGKWDEAIRSYEAVLADRPETHRAWIGIGNCRYFLGDRDEARGAYERALQVRPGEPQALNNLAHMLGETGGDPGRALRLSEEAVARTRDAIPAIEASLKDAADSLRPTLEWLLQLRRNHLAAYLGTRGDLLHAAGRCSEAARAYAESAELAPSEKERDSKRTKSEACRGHANGSDR